MTNSAIRVLVDPSPLSSDTRTIILYTKLTPRQQCHSLQETDTAPLWWFGIAADSYEARLHDRILHPLANEGFHDRVTVSPTPSQNYRLSSF